MSTLSTVLIGPCLGDVSKLESVLRSLFFDVRCGRIFYFGEQEEAEVCLEHILRDVRPPDSLVQTAVSLALMEDAQHSAGQIGELLDRVRHARRLQALRVVPDAPKKHVEMIRNRLMIMTRDHKHLAEDDIANATLIVYVNKKQSIFKRFGKRAFFAPPPLSQDALGMVHTKGPQVDLSITTLEGEVTWTEPILAPKTKMTVST